MKQAMTRGGTWLAGMAVLLLLSVSGCAQTRPCMIIPAQIELAKSKRDQIKAEFERKLDDAERARNNMEVTRSRLERMQEERDQLKSLLGENGNQETGGDQ